MKVILKVSLSWFFFLCIICSLLAIFPRANAKTYIDDQVEKTDRISEGHFEGSFDKHTIGVLLPLTGSYSEYGLKALKGIELALSRFNSSNKKTPMRIVLKDVGVGSASTSAVRELWDQNVAAIIGPLTSCREAAIEAQKRGVPIITMTQEEGIPEIGDYVFRNFITPKVQTDALVSYAVQDLGITRFDVLYPDEKYGRVFEKHFRESVESNGAEVVSSVSYQIGETDFEDEIKKLTKGTARRPENSSWDKDGPAPVDFEAVFIPDAPQTVGLVAPQLLFFDVENVLLMGTNLLRSQKLISMAGKYVQNAIFPTDFLPESSRPSVQEFVAAFRESYGDTPGFIEAVAYDTAMMTFETSANPNVKSRSDFMKVFKKTPISNGVLGSASINSDGDIFNQPSMLQIRGNSFLALDEQITIQIAESEEKGVFRGGTYEVIVDEGKAIFQTVQDGAWQIPEEDQEVFEPGEKGTYTILSDSVGMYIQIDENRKFYIE